MKELLKLQGGYPRAADYLLNLQTEFLTASNSLLNGLGIDLVLSGCAVVDNGNGTVNIAAGIAYVSGEILRFDGASNVPADGTKALVKAGYAATDPHEFQDETTKNIYREAKVIIGDMTSINQVVIRMQLMTIKYYIESLVAGAAFPGERKSIMDLDGNFLTNFDETGLGVTPRYLGWALENGNNGTMNTQGLTDIGAGKYIDPVNGEETTYVAGEPLGERKHKLTTDELAKFRLKITYKKGQADQNESGTYGSLYDADATHDRETFTNYVGNDVPHNNMQPSMPVYRIVRIA